MAEGTTMRRWLIIFVVYLTILQIRNAEGQSVSILPNEKTVKKYVNDSYFVSCTSSDGTTRAEWINPKSQRVDSGIHSRIRVEISYGVDLFLTRITTQDAGVYTCKYRNAVASFNLSVIRPVVFDTSFAEQSAAEGSNYKMKCVAKGHSEPKIYWKVDQEQPKKPKYTIQKDGLIIHNVSQADGNRTYVCRAMDMESPMPDAKLMNITLKVRSKPRWLGNPRAEYWGVMGEWANLTCAVTAEPPAHFEWRQQSRKLASSDDFFIVNDENVSTLQVLVKREDRFGQYTCTAKNELGQLERHLHLYRGQKPPQPTLDLEVVSRDAAKIRVKYGPTRTQNDKGKVLEVTGFVVQYKMLQRNDWIFANISSFDGGFVVKGLTPQVTYMVRAAARNAASIGDYSQPIRVVPIKENNFILSTATTNHFHLITFVTTILIEAMLL